MAVVTDGGGVSLELTGIVKRFGDLTAVSGFDISFAPGQVHALLGENGAGKSTLMNVAAGFLTPDVGEIVVGGQQVLFGSPKDAIDAGIGMVHQHFSLVEHHRCPELGDWRTGYWKTNFVERTKHQGSRHW